MAASFIVFKNEIGGTAVAGLQIEFVPVISFAAFRFAHDDAANHAVVLAGKISVHSDAQARWILEAHVKKCGTNRLKFPVMRRVSSRMPRPAASWSTTQTPNTGWLPSKSGTFAVA